MVATVDRLMRRLLGVWCIGCFFAVPAFGATPSPQLQQQQFKLASGAAAKILVKNEGWHRVLFTDLKKAGFAVPKRTSTLQLYVEGKEVRIRVTNKAVEFYGVPIETLSTNRQTYWLVADSQRGLRIPVSGAGAASGEVATAVSTIAVLEPRESYYASVLNKDKDNWHGKWAVRPADDVRHAFSLPHVNPKADAALTVGLQGFSALPHRVRVSVNGTQVGMANFTGQVYSTTRFPVAAGTLKEGENVVTLRALGGELDYSLVDVVTLAYNRFLVAEKDVIDLVLPAGQRARFEGFTGRAVRVMDVTNPSAPVLIRPAIESSGKGFAARVGSASKARHLHAFVDGAGLRPDAVVANRKSTLYAAHQRADLVVITHGSFRSALAPLVAARKREGLKVVVADVEDVYDEFGYGTHGPEAIKEFLQWTRMQWASAPRFLLLVGDASFDSNNELGRGFSDFVPTRLVDTVYLETASDDWLADFDNDGVPELSIGRLPVRTLEQAKEVIAKILRYGSGSANPSREMLLVSDSLKDYDFEAASQTLYGLIPATWTTQEVKRAQGPNDAAVKSRLLSALNEGPSIVNFFGHGSVGIWTSGSILTAKDALALRNTRLTLYVMMTCLNGFFHDPELPSLGESLLYNPSGGAAAVWSSTGETVPTDQIAMDQKALSLLFDKPETTTLGDAMVQAKASVRDMDVRRTWVLFGDPTMHLH